jgi:CRP-like cAMP-binding protein
VATKLEVLGTIPLFAALSKRQRRKLLRGMRVFDYEPGHSIVRQGDEGETMFVVLEGEARVVRGGRTVGRLLPGDVFGEVSVFDARPRTATVKTVMPTSCLALHRDELRKMLADEPRAAWALLGSLAKRLRGD